MSSTLIGLTGLVVVLGLMFLRISLAYSFAFVGGLGLIVLSKFQAGMSIFSILPFSWATTYTFSCLPMFILMGLIIAEADVAKDLYVAANKWLGRLPGGLAIASLVACAFFSAVSGTALAAAATIGAICYPEMRRYKYDPGLASGSIAVGATMDIMIPPSLPMIIFAMVADVSIGRMFIAGVIPGLLQLLLFAFAVMILVKRMPSLAPLATDVPSFAEKVKALKGVAPVLFIFVLVFGGLYGGLFTPTEAGACGVVVSGTVAAVMGRLSWKGMRSALTQTLEVTGAIFAIIIGVMIFSTFLGLSGLSGLFSKWVVSTGISPVGFLALVLLLYIPLGAVLEEISMMMLTLPFFIPAAQALGIDLIWFGILIIVAWQIGLVAPPVGMIAFVTQGVVKEPSIVAVYRGCLPFIGALIVVEVLLLLFPEIVLLPVQWMG